MLPLLDSIRTFFGFAFLLAACILNLVLVLGKRASRFALVRTGWGSSASPIPRASHFLLMRQELLSPLVVRRLTMRIIGLKDGVVALTAVTFFDLIPLCAHEWRRARLAPYQFGPNILRIEHLSIRGKVIRARTLVYLPGSGIGMSIFSCII